MKKVISLFLIACMLNLFSLESAFATNLANTSTASHTPTTQVNEINGVEYYFEQTNGYTLSIALHADGLTEVALKYSENPDEIFYNTYYSEDTSFNQVKTDVFQENIPLSIYQVKTSTIEPLADKSDCFDWLEDHYGAPYGYKTIATKSVDGYTVTIKEKHEYQVTKKNSYLAEAGLALTVIAAMLSVPTNIILAASVSVGIYGGVQSVINDVLFTTYNGSAITGRQSSVKSKDVLYTQKLVQCQMVTGDSETPAVSGINTTYGKYFNDLDSNAKASVEQYKTVYE